MTETYAAVDLGSNSFHLVVARVVDGFEVQIQDRIKERVKLAAGLDTRGRLNRAAIGRALDCLERFGERLEGVPQGHVRAVGTNTLRKARNGPELLAEGERVLGHPIEVISGREEARLVYAGVVADLDEGVDRLVVDIGGGSTELVLGQGSEPRLLDSLYMGCVSWSQRFFGGQLLKAAAMDAAITAARLEISPVENAYRTQGWQQAIGSSGTIVAIERILMANGWSKHGITPKGLAKLRARILEAKKVSKLDLDGLSETRRDVIAGGAAILTAVFEALELEEMHASTSALREGLLFDLVGRRHAADARELAVDRMLDRFLVDRVQAERVATTAVRFFDQASGAWSLDVAADKPMLRWAGRLHELGMFLSHSGYHKHGAYVLTNADVPGFSKQEQRLLAALVLSHRGRLDKSRVEATYGGRPGRVLRLAVLLRLAVRLHRLRGGRKLPHVGLEVDGDAIDLAFPEGWLESQPLTLADLDEERRALAAAGFTLRVS